MAHARALAAAHTAALLFGGSLARLAAHTATIVALIVGAAIAVSRATVGSVQANR